MPTGHDDSGPPTRGPRTGAICITVNEPQNQMYVRWPSGDLHVYDLGEEVTEHWIINSIANHIQGFAKPGRILS